MAAVPPALVSAPQAGPGGARFRFGQEVAQPPGEDRDGAAASVLEYQQVDIRVGGLGLQAQQAHGRIQDEPVPRRPRAPAGPADLEGAGCALDGHSLNYKGAGVRLPALRNPPRPKPPPCPHWGVAANRHPRLQPEAETARELRFPPAGFRFDRHADCKRTSFTGLALDGNGSTVGGDDSIGDR